MEFKGISRDAFDAYAPEKWSSNVHNLARMRTKDIMLALCDKAAADLTDEIAGLARAASDEVPNITNQQKVDSQWVYWFRGPKEREALASFLQKTPLDQATIFNTTPQDKHATLAVVLREQGLWIGLRIAPGASIDRRNFASKLAKSWERERFAELLGEMPEGVHCGLDTEVCPTIEADLAWIEGEAQRVANSPEAWQIGHLVEADEAIGFGDDLPDHVGRWLGTFTPLYRFVAWSRDNDNIEVAKKIQEEKAEKRRKAVSFKKGDKVRIIAGLFSGKRGVVEAIDTKAKVKVRVGKMSVMVSGKELTAAR